MFFFRRCLQLNCWTRSVACRSSVLLRRSEAPPTSTTPKPIPSLLFQFQGRDYSPLSRCSSSSVAPLHPLGRRWRQSYGRFNQILISRAYFSNFVDFICSILFYFKFFVKGGRFHCFEMLLNIFSWLFFCSLYAQNGFIL